MHYVLIVIALLLAACSQEAVDTEQMDTIAKSETAPVPKPEIGQMFMIPLEVERYFSAYKAHDADALIDTLSDDVKSYFYPSTLIAEGKNILAPMIRDDIASRPEAYAEVISQYRTGNNEVVTLADSINGEERAPVLFVFGLDPESGKINRQHTLIMAPFFTRGPSLSEPTEAIRNRMAAILKYLVEEDLALVAVEMAPEVSAYAYPPGGGDEYGPLITGASDVASVLLFKWGENAWNVTEEYKGTVIWHVMHYALVAIPAAKSGLDRVMLVTFDPDPQSENYEKIIKVDLMGPSGG